MTVGMVGGAARRLQCAAVLALMGLACSAEGEGARPGSGAAAALGGSAGAGSVQGTGGAAPLGGASPVASGGTGLYSDVFEPAAGGPSGGGGAAVPACEPNTAGCDFTRQAGCCAPVNCDHANGANVWDTYPIQACTDLVACVQANPGCTTAADPLCLQNEAPTAPCLDEAYLASHTDPEGPFAYTLELMRCLCGY